MLLEGAIPHIFLHIFEKNVFRNTYSNIPDIGSLANELAMLSDICDVLIRRTYLDTNKWGRSYSEEGMLKERWAPAFPIIQTVFITITHHSSLDSRPRHRSQLHQFFCSVTMPPSLPCPLALLPIVNTLTTANPFLLKKSPELRKLRLRQSLLSAQGRPFRSTHQQWSRVSLQGEKNVSGD